MRDVREAVMAFGQLVADVDAQPPLDEGALLIAAVGTGADVDAGLARLDDLAADVDRAMRAGDGFFELLFGPHGFTGNTLDYADPRNSFLPDVLDRRLGIPITLSVLAIEVGRRIGVGLHGVGMPGHFLVGVDAEQIRRWFDPFHGGDPLDEAGCRELFARLHGPAVPFRAELLAPTPPRAILLRMLANLRQTYVARRSPEAAWVVTLQLAFPELPTVDRVAIAEVLGSVGAFTDAAQVLEGLAERADGGTERDRLARQAVAFRSRAN